MPRGPKGEKRKADVVGNAILIGKIATGEVSDGGGKSERSAAAKLGQKGGRARAKSLTATQRAEIARVAAEARWKKS